MINENSGVVEQFASWALIETFGHGKFAGYATSVNVGGISMLRVDVPEVQYEESDWAGGERVVGIVTLQPFTKYLGAGSIFGITPTTEGNARAAARAWRVRPIDPYLLPQIEAKQITGEIDES